MTDGPRSYSALSADQQAQLSVWIDRFDRGYEYEGTSALKKALQEAPDELRVVLLSQLLPPVIDQDRKQHGRTPTLHELRARFPDLAGEMTAAYPLLPDGYRLPVELRGYRVLQVVGEGGQALVLRAQDDVHSAVAIKLSASPQHNDHLLRERQLLGECQHPGVPEVIASGVEEDRAFFIMPFLRGMTLADRYATHRPSPEEAAGITAKLCDIVAHLHSRGILHRDIKPQNVWIDDSGAVKLIDLGMAIDRSSWGAPRAAVSVFHGSPAFMSPEQAAADSENDGELSDVFSIGATLYWLGTGKPPYEGASTQSLLDRAASARFDRDLLQTVGSWPKPLIRVCLEAMAPTSIDRTSSVAELGERLRAAVSGTPRTVERPLRKSIGLIAAAAMVAVVAVLANPELAGSWLNGRSAEHSAVSSEPAESETQAIPAPVEEPWLRRAAAEAGVTLAAVEAEDFTVSVNCLARLIEPWGVMKRNPSASPHLVVSLKPELTPLADALQYRVGESSWGSLQPGDQPATYTTPLSTLAAGGHGPVEVRLVSDPRGRAEALVGPFRFDLDIAQALQEDEQAFSRSLLKEATTEKVFDVTQPGWAIREEYSRRLDPIIDEFLFGEKPDGTLKSLSERLDELSGASRAGAEGRPGYGLREGFAIASKDLQEAQRLWVKIRFNGGATWGPVLYEKPLTEAQKEKQRVLQWFDRLGTDDKLAQLTQTQFVMTRLNEIAPSLTHLHFVGTRRFVNGDPTHVKSSPSGDPKDNKIDDRPSSEMVVELSRVAGDRTIEIPPVWSPVKVRGRFPDGTFTPSFEVYNSKMTLCCCSVSPFDVSTRAADRELYVYIQDDTAPISFMSIAPLLPDADRLPREVLDRCHRTRLSLASPLPEEAVAVEYFSDSQFKIKIETAQPGIIYARYVKSDKGTLGYSAYKLNDAFMREWLEHALDHAKGPSSHSSLREPRPPR